MFHSLYCTLYLHVQYKGLGTLLHEELIVNNIKIQKKLSPRTYMYVTEVSVTENWYYETYHTISLYVWVYHQFNNQDFHHALGHRLQSQISYMHYANYTHKYYCVYMYTKVCFMFCWVHKWRCITSIGPFIITSISMTNSVKFPLYLHNLCSVQKAMQPLRLLWLLLCSQPCDLSHDWFSMTTWQTHNCQAGCH